MPHHNRPKVFGYNNSKRFFVTAANDTRLGDLLQRELGDKCDVATVIGSGGVWLGKTRCDFADMVLQKGDTVKVYITGSQGLAYRLVSEQIIFEDDDVLVVLKPPGITAVPDRSNLQHNLTYAVSQYLRSKGINYSPAPLTRLDYMVGGLSLFGKHKAAVAKLTEEMKQRRIHKLYRAIVPDAGELPACKRVRNKLDFFDKAFVSDQGKDAHSLFFRRALYRGMVVYSVILLTGRRHQIRAHAAQALQPLLGDDLYGTLPKGAPRQIGLLAVGLNFTFQRRRYRIRLADESRFWDDIISSNEESLTKS